MEESDLEVLRKNGWRVAIHNDYNQQGEPWTFWLMTHAGTKRFVIGEGLTDELALERCKEQAADMLRRHEGVLVLQAELEQLRTENEKLRAQLNKKEIHSAFYHGFHGIEYDACFTDTVDAFEEGEICIKAMNRLEVQLQEVALLLEESQNLRHVTLNSLQKAAVTDREAWNGFDWGSGETPPFGDGMYYLIKGLTGHKEGEEMVAPDDKAERESSGER